MDCRHQVYTSHRVHQFRGVKQPPARTHTARRTYNTDYTGVMRGAKANLNGGWVLLLKIRSKWAPKSPREYSGWQRRCEFQTGSAVSSATRLQR